MVILIAGASHTGKTLLAQKLLTKYHYPYLSLDHLKMGLIRSKQTNLTVSDDEKLIPYLWNIVKEIIKTVIENNQNLIIEGCYIPFNYQDSFTDNYLSQIKYCCLIMSEDYLRQNFSKVKNYQNIIEERLTTKINLEELIKENNQNLSSCLNANLKYHLIDARYNLDLDL